MKSISLRFGIISTMILLASFIFSIFFWNKENFDYQVAEITGFATIFLAMSVVFFGIRFYRDQENAGRLAFWEGVKVGLAISILPMLAFAIFNFIFFEVWGDDFLEMSIAHFKEQMSAQEFAEYQSQWTTDSFLTSSLFQAVFMGLHIPVVGFIISLISSFFLKKESGAVEAA